VLPVRLQKLIKEYVAESKPKKYLFEGDKPGEKYSYTSMTAFLRMPREKQYKPQVHLHMLRHSFATHALEQAWISDMCRNYSVTTT